MIEYHAADSALKKVYLSKKLNYKNVTGSSLLRKLFQYQMKSRNVNLVCVYHFHVIVHHLWNEHFRHVQVMDRLVDNNCLAYADGLTMVNSNDYVHVLERMGLSKRAMDLKYLVSMNRVVSNHSVKLMSMVVGHHLAKVVQMARNVLYECVVELSIQNLVQQIVLLVAVEQLALVQTLDNHGVYEWEPMVLVLVERKLVVVVAVAMVLEKMVAVLA